MALLEFVKGSNQGTKYELVGDRVVFGRNADCHVVINAPAVSREHAVIRKIDGRFFIEDMNSRNGTEVNSKRITMRTRLENQDQIAICGNVMTFFDKIPLPVELRKDATAGHEHEDEDNSTVEATIQSQSSSKQLLELQPADRLALLIDIGVDLTQMIKTEDLLPKIVDKLFHVFRQADRGFIILKEEEKLLGKVIKTRRQGEEDKTNFSRKIVNLCIAKGEAILSEDATSDRQFDLSQSIADCKIRSMICAPLKSRSTGAAFGVIQLDTQDRFKKFTQDDLRVLLAVAAQAGVAIENAKMHESLVNRAELERDLELAHRVQKSFLPNKLPVVPGYEFFAYYEPAQEVGGDYYDFIPLPQGRFGVMIGDVAGKGIPAALLMAKVSSDAKFCTLTEPSLVHAIGKLNEHMQEAGQLDRFITFGACVLDLQQHSITVVNAGHLPPLVYRASTKTFEQGCTKDQTGFPLGILEGIPYDCNSLRLAPGDSVLLVTDGITESKSRDEKEFGMDGAMAALKLGPMLPTAMGERLVDAVHKHAVGRKPHDDLTVVAFGRVS